MFDKVLLPVDFTEGDSIAIENSDLKSELEMKELVLLNVINESVIVELLNRHSLLYSHRGKELENVVNKSKRKSEEKLRSLSKKIGKLFNVETVPVIVKAGIPYGKICDTAEEEKVSVIPIPMHGKMNYSKEIFGSVRIHVLKQRTVPFSFYIL